MNPFVKKLFEHPLILLKGTDNGGLVCVDNQTTVTFLDKNTYNVKNGFKAKIIHTQSKSRVVDFSSDAHYFATVGTDDTQAVLVNVKTRKTIAKITRHQGVVSCVGIEPKNRYMFSCGEDGKTFAMDMASAKLSFTLPIHSDSITDIAFSDNGVWLATGGYDKKVFLFNLDRMTHVHRLIGHSGAIRKIQFLDAKRVFSIDNKGDAIVWDVQSAKVIKRLEGIHDSVLHVSKSADNKFLFLATELGYVLVYEMQNYTPLSLSYIKITGSITAFSFDELYQNLIIATSNKEMLVYDIYEGLGEIEAALKQKQYDNIYLHIKENPILAYTTVAQKMEALWELTLKKAIEFLQKNNKKMALATLKPFQNIPSKFTIIKDVVADYEEYEKFVLSIKQGKTNLAYSLANKHPAYKESQPYKTMETNWKKAFRQAQKYSIDPKYRNKAREILAPYRGVSEKTKLIKELFLQSDVYRRFKIAIGQKDFKLCFELINFNPFLKEFLEYDMLIQYADSLYIKAQKFLQENDDHSAIKILRVLIDFPDFKDEAKQIIHDIELRLKFNEAVKTKDLVQAYNIMSSSEELQDSKEGQILQEKWYNDLKQANLFAIDGDIKKVKSVLKDYMSVSSKYIHLANVFGWAYMVQLEQAIRDKKEQYLIEKGIKNYILCFGLQEQIVVFFKIFKQHYPKTKLNLELQTKGSMQMWRPSMIVDSILL